MQTTPQTITPADWRTAKRHGYASVTDGVRYVLTLDKGATVLRPVIVAGIAASGSEGARPGMRPAPKGGAR